MKVKVDKHSQIDKSFVIEAGKYGDLKLTVDYDDVDHDTVDLMVKALVSLLKNCPDPRYEE